MRKKFSERFLRGFSFSNVVLLKRTTFENLWKTSERFLKGSRSPEVFRGFRGRHPGGGKSSAAGIFQKNYVTLQLPILLHLVLINDYTLTLIALSSNARVAASTLNFLPNRRGGSYWSCLFIE